MFKEFGGSWVSLIATIVILVGMLICGLTSSHLFNANRYHNMVSIEEGKFDSDIPKVSEEMQLSIVDVATAEKVGDRTIGSIKNATWYEVDNEYNKR